MLLRNMPDGRKPVWTYAFVIACVAVYVLDAASSLWLYGLQMGGKQGILTMMGMRHNASIAAGQYWRLLTPVFLHSGLLHLGMNMLALLIWGPMTEYLFSGPKHLMILLCAGFMGCAAGFAFSTHTALGASGAVYGMMGALLSVRRHNKLFFDRFFGTSILVYIAVSIGMGFLQGGVDNIGHIGGLIGGYLIGVGSGMRNYSGKPAMRIGAVVLWGVLCAVCIVIGMKRY